MDADEQDERPVILFWDRSSYLDPVAILRLLSEHDPGIPEDRSNRIPPSLKCP